MLRHDAAFHASPALLPELRAEPFGAAYFVAPNTICGAPIKNAEAMIKKTALEDRDKREFMVSLPAPGILN